MRYTYDKDPYAILGIPSNATTNQIKQAYHTLARKYHPDLNKDPRASERMKDINWANDILSDPQERALYNMWRNSSVRFSPGAASAASSSTPPYRNSSAHTAHSPRRRTQDHWAQGCSPTMIIIIFIALMNALRSLQPLSQPVVAYSPLEFNLTQTAEIEKGISIIETFHAVQINPALKATTTPNRIPVTSSATVEIQQDEFGHPNLRSEAVPGSWLYEQIRSSFPELITFDGVSDEVTLIVYDQLRGYQIKTRTLGEYWILIDRYNKTIMPVHYPPTSIP